MTYDTRVDELVGAYVAEFQKEILLADELKSYQNDLALPGGYPERVFNPTTIPSPPVRQFVARSGGKLSNCVPWVVSMELVDGYPLGVYSQTAYGSCCAPPCSDPTK